MTCHWLVWKSHILSFSRGNRPAHYAITQFTKLITCKGFGEHISNLFKGQNMFDGNGFVNNMRTKMVQTNREMFCSRTRLVVGGYLNTALDIFESAALDNRR